MRNDNISYSYPRLPLWLETAITEVLNTDPWYTDPQKCSGMCEMASDDLVLACKKLAPEGISTRMQDTADGWHTYAVIGEYNIDLTARQFDPELPCPFIWHISEPTPKHIAYALEIATINGHV